LNIFPKVCLTTQLELEDLVLFRKSIGIGANFNAFFGTFQRL